MSNLTPRQEKFCHYYLETGNKTEAYRMAYDCSNRSDKTVNEHACRLSTNDKVLARIEELQEGIREEAHITRMDLVRELQKALEMSNKLEQPTALVSSVKEMSRLLGFDKQTIDIESGGKPLPTLVERIIIRPGDDTNDTHE